MSNNSIYSNAIFIGREKEITAFKELLSDITNEKWVLHLYGPGGIGKTQLLHRFIEIAQEQQANGANILFTQHPIDLYWTTNQQELGLLKSIAEQLSANLFEQFLKAVQAYEIILNRPNAPSPELTHEKLSQARLAFFDAYANLKEKQILLFFDTAEVGGEAVARFWQELLPQLKKRHVGTQAIIAGRQQLAQLKTEQTRMLPVTTFSKSEVNTFFQEHGLEIEDDVITRIAELSYGRPILIALAVDWLRYGFQPEKLIDCSSEEFERLMIRRIQELQSTEDQVITAMAHFYRRFDERFLGHILDKNQAEARSLIESVARFSFVKYRPPTGDQPGSCLLHDEMRELVNRYVWYELDPTHNYRQGEWNKKIISFYESLIQSERNALAQQSLQLERLFYWLSSGTKAEQLSEAFAYSQSLFSEARKRRDANLMEAINREFIITNPQLTPEMQDELAFRQSLVLHSHGHYDKAIEELTVISDKPNTSPILLTSVRTQLLEAYVYASELPLAVEHGLKWEKWLEKLLSQPSDDKQKMKLEFEFGKLCNNLGLAFRSQNKLQVTIDYYKKALEHFGLAGHEAYAEIANTKNNLGFVLHRLGHDDEALSHCKSALMIRERLRSAEQLGYSYNVRAIIFVDQLREQEARASFQMAYETFDKAGSERGKGLVNIAYGRALRQLGRHIERNAQGDFNPDRAEYLEADRMLQEAIAIFRKLEDEPNLSEALNEYGTLLRQQHRWADAIACFSESQELADQVKNIYRVVDNLVDIAITYDYQGNKNDALMFAEKAKKKAIDERSGLEAYNLFAKAQEVVANILFEQEDYDNAFVAVADACIYLWQLDPQKSAESPAKRELYYNQMVNWASEKILKLPNQQLVNEKTSYLIERWRTEKQGDDQLAQKYPGFITGLEDLARDYEFLKMNPVEE